MDPESNSNLSSSSDDQEQPAKKEKSPIKVHLNKPMLQASMIDDNKIEKEVKNSDIYKNMNDIEKVIMQNEDEPSSSSNSSSSSEEDEDKKDSSSSSSESEEDEKEN